MPIYSPVLLPSDLPAVGASHEHLKLDFKADVDPKDREELAKDIAALANAAGGTILVRAIEKREVRFLDRYLAMNPSDAEALRRAYSEAARDFCAPRPVIDPRKIDYQDGFVVACNVWPFPGQTIGVRAKENSDAYRFPLRVGTDTIFLLPEQLPIMNTDARRIAILLDAIPADAYVLIRATGLVSRGTRIVTVDLLTNRVTVDLSGRGESDRFVAVPLDAIQTVWQIDSTNWGLHLRGAIESKGWATPSAEFDPIERVPSERVPRVRDK